MSALPLSSRARRRLVDRGLDALTWLVLAVMLAMLVWVAVWWRTFRRDLEAV